MTPNLMCGVNQCQIKPHFVVKDWDAAVVSAVEFFSFDLYWKKLVFLYVDLKNKKIIFDWK